MTNQDTPRGDNTIKNPDDWTTGDEPMTDAQRDFLESLAAQTGDTVDQTMTKAEASKMIEDLREQGAGGAGSDTIRDPDEWTTGDEPMTGAQQSYLHTLATEAGETVPETLTKSEASKLIEELQGRTGRGTSAS